MSQFHNDAIFWVEVEKIKPNPYQPRREFNQEKLNDLADSIRQYGVLQPLVVTRNEIIKEDGGIAVEYELIAGERRHRASQIAGLPQVPVLIRSGQQDAREKLELAIIENLQREDLNPIDRGRAFKQLVDDFKFKHAQIAKKVGKSREYVSNTIRLLALPDEVQEAIVSGRIKEGHARPVLMLSDRPEQQKTLFKEMMYKKLTVRQAEKIARRIAYDRIRKKERVINPEIVELEEKLAESLGTRVHIEEKDIGGRIVIDFFSPQDLQTIIDIMHSNNKQEVDNMLNNYINKRGLKDEEQYITRPHLYYVSEMKTIVPFTQDKGVDKEDKEEMTQITKDPENQTQDEPSTTNDNNGGDLYSINNFSI